MPIAYSAIKRQAALKSQQIEGTDQATLEAAYTGAFTSSIDGAAVPVSAFKDVILMIEKELAHIIGSQITHPYRTFLYGRTANLADLASTPSVDNASKEFVGVFDSCADASTSRPCTWAPTQTIADIVDGASAYFGSGNYYYYNINGAFIRHTRTNVFLQGCVWDYTTQAAAYDANGNSPLPEMLANTWVAGVIANLPQVGWTDAAAVAPYYSGIYQQGVQLLSSMTDTNVPLTAAQNTAAN